MASDIKKRSIEITIQTEFKPYVKSSWLRSVIKHALLHENPSLSSSLSVAITDDPTIRKLNLQFRNFDEITDVLAFGNHGEFEIESHQFPAKEIEFPKHGDSLFNLGEVIVSYPQALRQAEENAVSIDSEVALLVIHGILHLLGYEHHTNDQEIFMKKTQANILSSFLEKSTGDPNGQ